MRIVQPSYEILTPRSWFQEASKIIEVAGRVCYKSEDKIGPGTDAAFLSKIAKNNHESVTEHFMATVRFICDRGVSHEIVRHRLASFSQESTRYCNYTKGKFDGHIQLIHPPGLTAVQKQRREHYFWLIQKVYNDEIAEGIKPQIARGLLPNALKTEIVVSANLREWRWIFLKRCDTAAHPQMRELMLPLRCEFQQLVPVMFDWLFEELSAWERWRLIPEHNFDTMRHCTKDMFCLSDIRDNYDGFMKQCDAIGVPRFRREI